MSDGHNPYRLMGHSQRILALARRDGVDTSRRSEVDRWYAANYSPIKGGKADGQA